MAENRTYIAIDLKSFYASVECRERGLDPLDTNLIVADISRTEKTICLAVTPSLKGQGVPSRPRLFEVIAKVKNINIERLKKSKNHQFSGSSYIDSELKNDNTLELDYIIAEPRMALYVEYSTRIYEVYLKYFAPEDIVVYSIDEVFIDATSYLKTYGLSARDLTMKIIHDVLDTTGITATAGIGTNLFLCKVAMDIVAKHIPADKDGVRIAILDEMSFRKELWNHRPLTDFWRIGAGYTRKLEAYGLYTLGDIARCSVGKPNDFYNEDLLYHLFGVNAELLIDHAWGYEPTTIKMIKKYKPITNSLGSGQVLHEPYTYEKARLVALEMVDSLALDLVDKGLITDQLVITIGYDKDNLKNKDIKSKYNGEVITDAYGRQIPKHSHGTKNLGRYTSSSRLMSEALLELFDDIVNPSLLVRRVNITANHVIKEDCKQNGKPEYEQLSFLVDYEEEEKRQEKENEQLEKEHNLQHAMLKIKGKYGKNAILKGMSLVEGATAKDRNEQIGGHKA